MITKFYYSVQNGGDGSAYPKFMESSELAEWDQDHMSEGWGESCTGYLEVESFGNVAPTAEVITALGYLIDECDYETWREGKMEDHAKFLQQFFPNGAPEFDVSKPPDADSDYTYFSIIVDEKVVTKIFAESSTSIAEIRQKVADCFEVDDDD